MEKSVGELIEAAEALSSEASALSFAAPVAYVYNPLEYAWEVHRDYLEKYGGGRKRIIFLGMNPGPWGMAQVGVPFGEVAHARDWLKVAGRIDKPTREHPKRPIDGFDCPRSEVSGRRLWGFFASEFGTPENFFRKHYVANYCPLSFMAESGLNITPDKLPAREREPLFAACDRHLVSLVRTLNPNHLVGVGRFAADRAARALTGLPVRVSSILHPSPASPAANRGWEAAARKSLVELNLAPP